MTQATSCGRFHFWVDGRPASKGSVNVYRSRHGKISLAPAVKRLNAWQTAVGIIALDARQRYGGGLETGPIKLSMDFCFVGRRKGLGWHVSKPDLDKLERAVLDALTGVLYKDDAQVCRVESRKVYATRAGLWCQIERLDS